MGIIEWLEKARNRDQWRRIVEEAKAHPGLQRREEEEEKEEEEDEEEEDDIKCLLKQTSNQIETLRSNNYCSFKYRRIFYICVRWLAQYNQSLFYFLVERANYVHLDRLMS